MSFSVVKRKSLSSLFAFFAVGLLVGLLVFTGAPNAYASDEKATKNEILSPETLEIACKTKMSMVIGTIFESLYKQSCPDSPMKYYRSVVEAAAGIINKKVDGLFTTSVVLTAFRKEDPSLIQLGDVIFKDTYAPAVKKGNTKLLEQINHAVETLKEDGTLAKMNEYWLSPETDTFATDFPEDMPRDEEYTEVLKVGMNPTQSPFVYSTGDDSVKGYSAELSYRIADLLHMRVEFVYAEFSGLLPGLQTGKSDVILNILTPTPEREKAVDFGIPYTQVDVVLVGRDDNYSSGLSFFDTLRTQFTKSFITNERYKMFFSGLSVTFLITFAVLLFATFFGIILTLMARCGVRTVKVISDFYCNFFKSIPNLVIILIVFYIVFQKIELNPLYAAIVALTLSFSANMCLNFKHSYDLVSTGEVEAARAMGFTSAGAFTLISLPKTVKNSLQGYRETLVTIFKESSIVGYIAVEDLTHVSNIITSQTFSPFFTILVSAAVYAAIIWILIFSFKKFSKVVTRRR